MKILHEGKQKLPYQYKINLISEQKKYHRPRDILYNKKRVKKKKSIAILIVHQITHLQKYMKQRR